MKSIAIGIGSYGISVITEISNSDLCECVIAVDSDKTILEKLTFENKITVSKRLPAYDAVVRIQNKLKKMIPDCEIVFVISNPIDLPSPLVITEIVNYVKSLGYMVIALSIDPHGKFDRKQNKIAKQVIESLINMTPTIRIPQKNIRYYTEPNYRWYEYYLTEYSDRDNILEQVEFDNWYKNSCYQEHTIEKDVLVGIFYLQRIIELYSEEYPCASKEDIYRIFSLNGIIHIATATAIQKKITNSYFTEKAIFHEFARLLRTRACFNDILDTSTHNSMGLIFILNIPESTAKEEFTEICYMLHSFSNESVDSTFTVNIIKSNDKTFSVKLLATGADDMSHPVPEY